MSSVSFYLFHFLPLKLSNKGMDFLFFSLKLLNKGSEEYFKMIFFIPFISISFPLPKQRLMVIPFHSIMTSKQSLNESFFFMELKKKQEISIQKSKLKATI